MKISCSLIILLTFAFSSQGYGGTGASDSTSPTAPENSPFPLKDYSGDFCNRPNLLGNCGGKRNELAMKGITFETEVTQIFQGNVHGGKNTTDAWGYSGSADYWLKFDTQRMGLWPAGLITLHGETSFGNSPFLSVGSILPVNYDALLPEPGNPGLTTLSEYYLTQFFSEEFGVLAGKVDPTTLADNNVFADNEKTQFINTGLRANPAVFLYAPYTTMAAAAFYIPNDYLTIGLFATDNNSSVRRTGFDTAFHSPIGTTFGMEWNIKVKPWGLPGHQRMGYAYSNKTFTKLKQDPRIILPPNSSGPEKQKGDAGVVWYNFDQYLYVEDDDPTQGVGIFGRFGYTDGNANPIQRFYSFGIGGKGICQGRDNDTFGVGYYYVDLSNDLPRLLNLSSEQGVELFYNIEITKSIHITPDLQFIVDPGAGFGNRDNAVVFGCRLQMSF
ncbi:MAG: carbohydrate porin [Planctomycetota bacterium]|jgi:porin